MTYSYALGRLLPKLSLKVAIFSIFLCVEAHARGARFPLAPAALGNPIDTITPLQIGDTIPEALWNLPLQVINHPEGKETITLNDYRGKLIILDFWNSACAPCIKAFPKLSQMQQQFSGQAQFILPNRESLQHVKRLMDKDMIPPGLPVPFGEHSLFRYFPYRVVPHYVWLSPDGRVLTATGVNEVTPDRIRDALAGKTAFNAKIDIMTGPPYFTRDAIQSDRLVSYTMLFKGNYPGLPSKVTYLDTTDTPAGISVTNYPLADLYQFAALPTLRPYGVTQPRNRTVYECRDTSALSKQYTYERVGPPMKREALRTHMLDELNTQTDFFGQIEMREWLCYIIQRDATDNTTAPPVVEPQRRNLRSLTNLWNAAMGRLKKDVILLDESGYTGPVDVAVTRIRDADELDHALRPYGLRVVQAKRSIPMLIISDDPKNQLL